jgi:hypothetical protein
VQGYSATKVTPAVQGPPPPRLALPYLLPPKPVPWPAGRPVTLHSPPRFLPPQEPKRGQRELLGATVHRRSLGNANSRDRTRSRSAASGATHRLAAPVQIGRGHEERPSESLEVNEPKVIVDRPVTPASRTGLHGTEVAGCVTPERGSSARLAGGCRHLTPLAHEGTKFCQLLLLTQESLVLPL